MLWVYLQPIHRDTTTRSHPRPYCCLRVSPGTIRSQRRRQARFYQSRLRAPIAGMRCYIWTRHPEPSRTILHFTCTSRSPRPLPRCLVSVLSIQTFLSTIRMLRPLSPFIIYFHPAFCIRRQSPGRRLRTPSPTHISNPPSIYPIAVYDYV